jgi:hypothetical protein
MAETIISCAGDNALAKDVYDRIRSSIGNTHISLDEDEIGIDHKSRIRKEEIKQILDSFIKSNPERLKNYQVVESGDILVVGIVVEPSKMDGLFTCEFCGYFTPYPEDLFVHKRMHAGGA